MMLRFTLENFVIRSFTQELSDAFMLDSKASVRKVATILMSAAVRKGAPLRMTSKTQLMYNRKSDGPRTLPYITPMVNNLC